MIAKRILKDNRYQVYVLPDNSTEIVAGIPLKVLDLSQIDYEELSLLFNDLLTSHIVKTQTTPNWDTINSVLRLAIMKIVNKLGETIYE